MTKDSLKRKIKEEGLAGSVLYYLGRFCSKAELAMENGSGITGSSVRTALC